MYVAGIFFIGTQDKKRDIFSNLSFDFQINRIILFSSISSITLTNMQHQLDNAISFYWSWRRSVTTSLLAFATNR